jgi:hypothetical protein
MTKLHNVGLRRWIKNPQWEKSIKIVRYACDNQKRDDNGVIRACLKIHKSDKPDKQKPNDSEPLSFVWDAVKNRKIVHIPEGCRAIKTEHKWTGQFFGDEVDETTGEIIEHKDWECTDMELALSRKRKAIKKFTDVYSPLYEQYKVSVMFLTLTRCNVAPVSIKQFIDIMQKRFLRHKIPVLGYFWVNEISDGFHHHYHIAIATRRLNFKKLPKWIKFDDVWGQGTSIEFIRKSVKAYLGKYIGKNNIGRMMNFRTYGRSQKYNIPT